MADVAINMHVQGFDYKKSWGATCSTQSVKHNVNIGTLQVTEESRNN
jgi:hypothetical protein